MLEPKTKLNGVVSLLFIWETLYFKPVQYKEIIRNNGEEKIIRVEL